MTITFNPGNPFKGRNKDSRTDNKSVETNVFKQELPTTDDE